MDTFNFTVCSEDKLNGFICETNLNKEVKNVETFKFKQAIAGPDDYNMTAGNTTNDIMEPYDF